MGSIDSSRPVRGRLRHQVPKARSQAANDMPNSVFFGGPKKFDSGHFPARPRIAWQHFVDGHCMANFVHPIESLMFRVVLLRGAPRFEAPGTRRIAAHCE
jgi:hypothetical protein